jgi:hypothetical protein
MGRKKKSLAEVVKKQEDTPIQMSIEDRLTAASRNDPDAVIYVGQLVERVLRGEFGAIIKALTAGRISTELSQARGSMTTSDRILGRLEMAENLWNDLEQFVLDKDKLQKPESYDQGVQAFNYSPEG